MVAPPGTAENAQKKNPLIGREKEWQALVARCELARNGQGGLLLIEGEAGIGKSTLIAHLSSWARSEGFQTVSGAYIGHHRVPPLSGLREAVSQLFFISSTDSREIIDAKVQTRIEGNWASLKYHRREIVRFLAPFEEDEGLTLYRPSNKEENPEERVQRFYYFLCKLLAIAAHDAPLIVFLEDFHWADIATMDCAQYLCARIVHEPVLLVAAYRPEESSFSDQLATLALEEDAQILGVSPLGVDAVSRMADAYGLGKHADFCQKLHHVSGGVPLFVEQWLDVWQEEHPSDPLSILSQIPKGITQLIRRRISSLTGSAQALLQVAAVLGVRFEPEQVARVSREPLASVLDALAQLEQRKFVHATEAADSRFVFHHAITRQVVYEGISEAKRRILHNRTAEVLEPLLEHHEERVFEAAHHYVAGHQALKASQVLFRAGQRAFALQAYEDAKSYHTQALEMLAEYPEEVVLRAEIKEALGDSEWMINGKSARPFWESALNGQKNSLRRCTLYWKLSRTLGHQPLQRIRYLQKALEETRAHPQSIERAQVLMDIMQCPRPDIADIEERSNQTVQCAAQSLRILRKHAPHKLLVQMLVSNLPSIREKRITNMKRARRVLHRAIRIAEELEDWEWIVIAHLRIAETWRGVDLKIALQEGGKALELAENRYPGSNHSVRAILSSLMNWSLALGDETRFIQYYDQLNETGQPPITAQEKKYPEDAWQSLVKRIQNALVDEKILHNVWFLSRLQRLAVENGKEHAWKQFILEIREKYGELLVASGLKQFELIEVGPSVFPVGGLHEIPVASLFWMDDTDKSDGKVLSGCTKKVIVPGPEVGLGWLNSAPSFLYGTSGDFVMEARISAHTHPQRAGGIVVWQDRSQFIRFASGVDHIGQISLGWHDGADIRYVGVGYHPSRELVLKLVRCGTRYEGFVSPDGKQWFTCGDLEFGHCGLVEVGLFAECNYEYSFPQPFPVQFENVRLWVEKVEEPVEEEGPAPVSSRPRIYPLPEVGELFYGMVGKSRVFREFCDKLTQMAQADRALVIYGETGVGKELAARAAHELNGRRSGPFVPVNVANIPQDLIDSEFFGHRKGAFTGATEESEGLFGAAEGGTLFLDEIAELPVEFQAKLLRALETGEIRRIGDTRAKVLDMRCVAATNQDLFSRMGQGLFREDLFYRLWPYPTLPPLRERSEDIPLLVAHFMEMYAGQRNITAKLRITQEAMERLVEYGWPGNVRELKYAIEHAVMQAQGSGLISVEHIPFSAPLASVSLLSGHSGTHQALASEEFSEGSSEEEKEELLRLWEECGRNIAKMSRRMDADRSTLYRRFKKAGLDINALRKKRSS